MPVAERRQSKDSDEIHQKPEGRMVGRGGLEPPTSRLSGVRSNQLSYRPPRARQPGQAPSRTGATESGGACRARTGDPLLAKQVLSQLS